MTNNSYTDFPLKGSICEYCENRMSTFKIPNNLDDLGELENYIEEDDEVILEDHICLESGETLDHIIFKCNKFIDLRENRFIRSRLLR